ncbi:Ig-like domain-containing protein, partial [Candidatus Binatia bacterium]|nr:Ig-like domain-containing protein [Candidatus Binatia bacterium]
AFARFVEQASAPAAAAPRPFASAAVLADTFGPSRDAYAAVRRHLERNGFRVLGDSPSRMTITARGTRRDAERAFATRIEDFTNGDRTFFANTEDPTVPAELAPHVQAILGLSDLAVPRAADIGEYTGSHNVNQAFVDTLFQLFRQEALQGGPSLLLQVVGESGNGAVVATSLTGEVTELSLSAADVLRYMAAFAAAAPKVAGASSLGKVAALGGVGAGQKIGILAFSDFRPSDVADYLALAGMDPALLGNVSSVAVNGGAPLGPGQSDVLLAIAVALTAAPGADVVVYHAPFDGSPTTFQALLDAMIGDGVTVIDNAWGYCEDQTTLADVQSMDALLATAAAAGITVVNAAGDGGSTCNDGTPNTAAVPASSPHATAVGGTTPVFGPGFTYGGESWWDGSSTVPPSGQGGFGASQFFPRPVYQDGLVGGAMRSLPDVAAIADPRAGATICEADGGGCPIDTMLGGTSFATHLWAAVALILNDRVGTPLGFLNPLLYPLAGSDAFHGPASMGSDVAHVGLGSPNVSQLERALTGDTPGPLSTALSSVTAHAESPYATFFGRVPADGTSAAAIVVQVRDTGNGPLVGKTVTLSNGGSSATIAPSSVATDTSGDAVFLVRDTTIEDVTFSATVDGTPLTSTAQVRFVSRPATAGGIAASPTSVLADGTSSATVTVTLQDENGAGTPGKLVKLSQGGAHSVISGPSPAVTNAAGQIQFTVTDQVAETVDYTAIDATDGNLPVPGTATVSFTGQGSAQCPQILGTVTPEASFAVSDFATGFRPGSNCVGPIGVAFDPNGQLYVADLPSGHIYRFGPDGGAASPATRITSEPSPHAGTCAAGLAFSKDGQHLYLARQFCNAFYGEVWEISPSDGSPLRQVTTIECATALATDPVSGDLFVSSPCGWFGGNNIYRVKHPETSPVAVEVYASPGPTDGLTFAPDGTLYSESHNNADNKNYVVRLDGTGTATPGAFTRLVDLPGGPDGIAVAVDPADPATASFLFVNRNDGVMSRVDLGTTPPLVSNVYTGSSRGDFVAVGPDGCAYATESDRIVKVTDADGSCPFAPTSPNPGLQLTPGTVLPNPQQGTTQTLTAKLFNATAPAGTPVKLLVLGANLRVLLGRLDATGAATFSYQGVFDGEDAAIATLDLDGTPIASNAAHVTWEAGPHITFVSGLTPGAGAVGAPVSLSAALYDVSLRPTAPVVGVTLELTMGAQSCSATTDAQGRAACSVVPDAAGLFDFTARFAGDQERLPARGGIAFSVLESRAVGCVEGCTLLATKDGFLRRADNDRNEGANPLLLLRRENHPIVAFDPAAIERATFTRARLVLTIAGKATNWRRAGAAVQVRSLLDDFAEGNGKKLGLRPSDAARGSGAGATWHCAADANVANNHADCDEPWDGGTLGPPGTSVLHTKGLAGEVAWDVTEDVRAGRTAWLLEKADEHQPGRVAYFSREGAAAAEDMDLAPKLVLD